MLIETYRRVVRALERRATGRDRLPRNLQDRSRYGPRLETHDCAPAQRRRRAAERRAS